MIKRKKIKNTPEACYNYIAKWLRNNVWISTFLYMRFRKELLSFVEVVFQIDNMEYMPYIEGATWK